MNFTAAKFKRLEGYLSERIALFNLRLRETSGDTGGDYRYQLKSEIDLLNGYLSMVVALKLSYPDLDQNGLPIHEVRKIVEVIRQSIHYLEDALSRWVEQGGHYYQTNGWEGELDENYALIHFIETLEKE